MTPIRVMLVDDSPLFVGALQSALDKDKGIQVVSTAHDGQEALDLVPAIRPDVIVSDMQMPRMTGTDFLRALLPRFPIPVVVISSAPGVTLTALQNGAVDFIQKPATAADRDDFFLRLRSTIRTASMANVGAKLALHTASSQQVGRLVSAPAGAVVAIGASTGGTDAILAVVRNLPPNCPGIVATQHMPPGFTTMYAERLNKECRMKVHEARDGQRLQPGTMILGAGGLQMRLAKDAEGYYVTSRPGEKVSGHIPSVDVLFESVAKVAGNKAVGILLTGMGADGAEGLLKMRRAGAYTIGQDKATSVVYGMPGVAFEKGAVAKQLPLDHIPAELLRYLGGGKQAPA